MGKHVLDDKVEEILQHYGIKGMKWKVTKGKSEESTSNGPEGGGGSSGEETEDQKKKRLDAKKMMDALNKNISKKKDVLGKPLNGVTSSIKKKGEKLIQSIFGKGKPKFSKAKPDKKLTKEFRDILKKADSNNKKQKNRSAGEKALDKDLAKTRKQLEKSGWKKHKKPEKFKGKQTSYTTGTSINGKPVGKDKTSDAIKKFKKDVQAQKKKDKKAGY